MFEKEIWKKEPEVVKCSHCGRALNQNCCSVGRTQLLLEQYRRRDMYSGRVDYLLKQQKT